MNGQNVRQVLLVAGDYDVIQSVQRALPAVRFNITHAFSHRDAVYMLTQSRYDALIVDSSMSDRHSGKMTMAMLSETMAKVPLIALAKGKQASDGAFVNALDQHEVQATLMRALNITVPKKAEVKVTTNLSKTVHSRRVDEINTLFALSKSLTEVLDLSEVLNRIVEAARDLTEAEEGMILLPEGEELYLRAKIGVDVDTARNFRIKTKDAIIGDVFKSGHPRLIGNSGPQKVKTEYFVNSMLYVPILLQGEIIGVLGVNNKKKKDLFDIHHQELLENLSSFAAVAIENARIHEESLERTRELETMVAASEVMNSSLSLNDLLPNICEQFASVLNASIAEMYTWLPDQAVLRTIAGFYKAGWRFNQGPSLDIARHPALTSVIENDRPRWLKDQDKAYSTEVAYLNRVGASSVLMFPLFRNGQFLGAIRLFYTTMPEPPPPQDLIAKAQKIALEIVLDLLNRTDRIISRELEIAASSMNSMLGATCCELLLSVRDSTRLVLIARVGAGMWLNNTGPQINLVKYPELNQALARSSILAIFSTDERLSVTEKELLARFQAKALLGIPLVQRGRAQGFVIFCETERDRQFTSRETHMARAIVGQASTALENANLVHDLEQSLKELRETQDRLVQTARLSAMGELAAVVAHQINNPLTTIIVDTEMMLLDEPEGTPNAEALQAIARAGKRAANVARRLLAIARPADSDSPSDLIDVVDTVRGVLSLVQTHIERSNIRIDVDFPHENIPGVMAVKGTLDDVWLNLIMNAHDALLGDHVKNAVIDIRVDYLAESHQVEVVIRDNGIGIPDAIKEQIFSPFFTTKPVGEGTGLGLHVCREVVENTGGTITVDSVPNEYTCFIVHLPAANK